MNIVHRILGILVVLLLIPLLRSALVLAEDAFAAVVGLSQGVLVDDLYGTNLLHHYQQSLSFVDVVL